MAIEPVRNHIVYNAQRTLQVLEAIDSPNLQVIFDPVNLLSSENYIKAEEIFNDTIDKLNNHIVIIHLKDFYLQGNDIVSVAAGEGCMDYRQILSFIKKEKPFIQVTLENTVPENAEKARRFLQSEYDRL